MRLPIYIMVLSVLFAAGCGTTADSSIETGDSLEFIVKPVDAAAVVDALKERKGKVVLINMWASWCDPCVEEFPDLVTLYETYKDRGLDVIGVSHDFEEQVESRLIPFIREHDAGFTHFLQNGQVAQDFIDGIDTEWSGVLPATFLYDREGRRAAYISGKFDTKELEEKIVALLVK
ncbi:TlpA disulfide reductase family protein [candidate division KSB1 bacterium]